MLNYKEIIENLETESVINLLQQLGADRYREEENCVIFPTICHNEDAADASMKLYYYKNSKLFVCYSNCETMSIFKFLEHYYDTRGIEYDWVNDVYNVVLNCSSFNIMNMLARRPKYISLREKYGQEYKEYQLPEYNKGVLDTCIRRYPPEWLNEGITREAMDRFNIRYSISQNKIVIPHYDVDGRLVGIRGRALNEWEIENVGKYMPMLFEKTWYKHPLSMNLFGLYENKNNIKKSKICFVAEGEKSVMLAENFGMPNCTVATCGSGGLNKYQLNLLLKHCQPTEIVLCYDKEELSGEDKYFNKLWALCEKYKNYANFSFVYDRQGLLELKDSPFDRGEEVFKQLIERRVKVN